MAQKPVFVEEDDLEKYQTSRRHACDNLRDQLKLCLMDSDCVKTGRTPKDCLNSRDPSVRDECYQLRNSFISCKRSIIDMRARFRGRKGDHH